MICEHTGKRCYTEQSAADYTLWLMRYRSVDGQIINSGDLHTYQCPECGHFHIGHQSMYVKPIDPSTFQLSPEMTAMGAALELINDWLAGS